MIRTEVHQFAAKDFNEKYKVTVNAWCEGMWFVVVVDDTNHTIKYVRNDGQLFSGMQLNRNDLSGGTYFPTQQDAEEAAKRYHATTNENNQSNKEETENQPIPSIQE